MAADVVARESRMRTLPDGSEVGVAMVVRAPRDGELAAQLTVTAPDGTLAGNVWARAGQVLQLGGGSYRVVAIVPDAEDATVRLAPGS